MCGVLMIFSIFIFIIFRLWQLFTYYQETVNMRWTDWTGINIVCNLALLNLLWHIYTSWSLLSYLLLSDFAIYNLIVHRPETADEPMDWDDNQENTPEPMDVDSEISLMEGPVSGSNSPATGERKDLKRKEKTPVPDKSAKKTHNGGLVGKRTETLVKRPGPHAYAYSNSSLEVKCHGASSETNTSSMREACPSSDSDTNANTDLRNGDNGQSYNRAGNDTNGNQPMTIRRDHTKKWQTEVSSDSENENKGDHSKNVT